MSWDERAACRAEDPELHFPISYMADNPQVMVAKAVCQTCPVQHRCREVALERAEPEGIWGGTTPRERRLLRGLPVLESSRG